MRLLGEERNGDCIDRYWLHQGDDGNDRITVETVQDAEPSMDRAKVLKGTGGKDFRFKASIPGVVVNEVARISARTWGLKTSEAFAELVQGQTDRAKKVWKMLTEGRDFSKFQARSY